MAAPVRELAAAGTFRWVVLKLSGEAFADPATGYGSPNSAYCLTKFVTWLPPRLVATRSGFAWRILSRNGLKSVVSVAVSSSPIIVPPFPVMNALAALARSWPKR